MTRGKAIYSRISGLLQAGTETVKEDNLNQLMAKVNFFSHTRGAIVEQRDFKVNTIERSPRLRHDSTAANAITAHFPEPKFVTALPEGGDRKYN